MFTYWIGNVSLGVAFKTSEARRWESLSAYNAISDMCKRNLFKQLPKNFTRTPFVGVKRPHNKKLHIHAYLYMKMGDGALSVRTMTIQRLNEWKQKMQQLKEESELQKERAWRNRKCVVSSMLPTFESSTQLQAHWRGNAFGLSYVHMYAYI